MENNKILIELEIPLIEVKYDMFIPINKKIGTIKSLIERSLIELTDMAYIPRSDTNLYSKETGDIYDNACEAAKVLSLDSSCIVKVCKGERKICGGYHWQFIKEEKLENKVS